MDHSIVQVSDPVLRQTATAVGKDLFGSRKLRDIIAHMQEALAAEPFGVAIAAPQIGEPLRIFVVAGRVFLSEEEEGAEETLEENGEENPAPPDMVFINPKLLRHSRGKQEMHEGCLSVRGVYGWVPRYEKATVSAYDFDGKPFTYHGSELLAEIFQHELDHLEGILFIDKAVRLDEKKDEAAMAPEKKPAHKAAKHKAA